MGFKIAIDGPSGSGKSTVAKMLAKELNIIYIDTGAMYRATGFYFLQQNICIDDEIKILEQLDNINLDIKHIDNVQHILLNGIDVTSEIRLQDVADAASKVALINEVRKKLVAIQKEIAKKNSVVMDGRDIATCVLTDANLKIYLDASVESRTFRRLDELKEKGIESSFDNIKREIAERDFRDKNREHNPLTKAFDAIYIDSSKMNVDEVKNFILNLLAQTKEDFLV